MVKNRIIPTLLWKDTSLVKGASFDSWRRVDTVLPAIKVFNMREVDELILLDISATEEGRDPDYESIKSFSEQCFVPFAVGGGITTIEHIKNLLRSGADKVVINTASYNNPELIREGSRIFGNQCIVASVDAKLVDGKYFCFSKCGKENTGIELGYWASQLELLGAGEIIITSIERDGTLLGYDHDMIREVTQRVKIPVIASGGAGSYEDFYLAIAEDQASAVAAASIFHFTEKTPKEAKMYLKSKGINVRK